MQGVVEASMVAQLVKNLPAMQETCVQSLGLEDPLEKEMATGSSILAWKISQPEETGRLQSMGHKESDVSEHTHIHTHTYLDEKDVYSEHTNGTQLA